MEPFINEKSTPQNEKEKKLLKALDKGIDDMEQGRTVSHEEAMKILREKIESYDI